jgi:glycosyltransferase involved in cell wall biosynthesis
MKLKQLGVDLRIFSIRKPPMDTPLSSFQLALQEQVKYLLPVKISQLILSHLFFSSVTPRRFFGTLIYLLTRDYPGLLARLKSLLHFSEGVYFAYFLRGQKVDEIHAHFLDRAAVLALVAKKLLKIPYSVSIHAGADIYVNPVLIREKLMEMRQAVTCTQHNKKHLEALIGPKLAEKIAVVPHGLNSFEFSPNLDPKGEMLILAVGQLKMRKGFLDLIEACKMLRDQKIDFQCEIIGNGPMFSTLNEKILEYSLEDKVFLCGALPNELVMEKYKRASLFVLPCKVTEDGDVDGIPNVLLESMAMNVPVISSRVSAIPELITDQENGILVKPDNPDELFKAIISLINSPEKRINLGREGRKTVIADFNIDRNIEKLAKTLWPELFIITE